MLADLIAELKPQLVRRTAKAVEAPPERLHGLVDGLVGALRSGRADVMPCRSHVGLTLDVEKLLTLVRALRSSVYDTIEERQPMVAPRDMRVLADWFAAIQELALREDNRRFAALLDAIPDHVALHDPDGRVLYANRAARAHAPGGPVEAGSFIGRTLTEIGIPESFVRQADADAARALHGETVRSEVQFPSAVGSHWREQLVGPVFGSDGKVEAVAFASRNIHARKLAEARLRLLSKVGTLAETMEYEGVLTAVARLSIPDLADWCIVDVVENGKALRRKVAHRDPEKAALTEKLVQLAPNLHDLPEGRRVLAGQSLLLQVTERQLREHAQDPDFYEVARQLGASSVLIVPFVVLGSTVAVGRFVRTPESGLVHGPEDLALAEEMARRAGQIIENARLHQQLRQSEARFRLGLAHANIVVFEEDRDFRVRWIYDPRMEAREDRLVGGSYDALLSREDAERLRAVKQKVLATGESVRTEVDSTIDGQRIYAIVHFEPLRDATGAIVGIMGAGVDVTDEKRAQEELTEALAFREQMMGVLGHDLRNPVGAVRGLAGLLQLHDGLPDKTREGLQRIDQSTRRMSEMIDTLLDFTQSRFRGSLPIEREAMDLLAVSRNVVQELRVGSPGREIRVTEQDEVLGAWDPARMAQVVSNLVGNALKHGAEDAPVDVSVVADGADAVLEVSNQGPVIPPELVGRLFEPFRRGDTNGNGTRTRGLGLGLYIVREIVAAHGGIITVRSTEEATRFSVRLRR